MPKNTDTTNIITPEIPLWQRYTMTIEEAAMYFHIGETKLRNLCEIHTNANFYMMNGNRILFKRERFEQFLDEATAI